MRLILSVFFSLLLSFIIILKIIKEAILRISNYSVSTMFAGLKKENPAPAISPYLIIIILVPSLTVPSLLLTVLIILLFMKLLRLLIARVTIDWKMVKHMARINLCGCIKRLILFRSGVLLFQAHTE